MASYNIKINATYDGTYTLKDIKEAEEVANAKCTDIYNRLNGCCDVKIVSIEEVKGE